jgi:hypothetical protein
MSMLISVVSLVSSCSVTSVAVILDVCRVFTSCTSSNREPVASFSNLGGNKEAHGSRGIWGTELDGDELPSLLPMPAVFAGGPAGYQLGEDQ